MVCFILDLVVFQATLVLARVRFGSLVIRFQLALGVVPGVLQVSKISGRRTTAMVGVVSMAARRLFCWERITRGMILHVGIARRASLLLVLLLLQQGQCGECRRWTPLGGYWRGGRHGMRR